MRIGLIGLGSIGGALAEAAAREDGVELVAALVAGSARTRAPGSPPCVASLDALLAARPEVVIECAGQTALGEHGLRVLRQGVDLVPASLGLFADDAVLHGFRESARAGDSRIRLSSGAVAGVDGLLAAARLGLDCVRYRFVMSPSAWGHAVDGPQGETATQVVVYRGSARAAAQAYPRHANVTATIALAGAGFERTEVELVVDSAATDNRHEIEAGGHFGTMSVAVTGRRISQASPSSRLVAGSLLAAALFGAPAI